MAGRHAAVFLLILAFMAIALSGCSAKTTGATTTSTSTTDAKKANCTPARGIDQGIEVGNGTYVAPDGSVWKESNGITHLQEIPTCEGPPDTKVAPPPPDDALRGPPEA